MLDESIFFTIYYFILNFSGGERSYPHTPLSKKKNEDEELQNRSDLTSKDRATCTQYRGRRFVKKTFFSISSRTRWL